MRLLLTPLWNGRSMPLNLELQRRHNLHLSLIYPALNHRLNIEVKLRSLFGLHVSWCAHLYSLAETLQPPPPPPPLDSNTKALLVSEDSPTKDCAVSAPEQDMMLRSEELQHAHQRCGQPSLRSQLALQQQARLAIYAPMIYTSVADPWHFGVDPALDSRIHASD